MPSVSSTFVQMNPSTAPQRTKFSNEIKYLSFYFWFKVPTSKIANVYFVEREITALSSKTFTPDVTLEVTLDGYLKSRYFKRHHSGEKLWSLPYDSWIEALNIEMETLFEYCCHFGGLPLHEFRWKWQHFHACASASDKIFTIPFNSRQLTPLCCCKDRDLFLQKKTLALKSESKTDVGRSTLMPLANYKKPSWEG